MSIGISLIVGLGNPGREHIQTRHNAGYWLLDRLVVDSGATLRSEGKFKAGVAKGQFDGKPVWLVEPRTYMNLSGDAVVSFARFYKIPSQQILVLHDDLDLSPGTVRLKQGGGAGGHNGLADITSKLGSKDYVRLRIGIGHPGSSKQVSSYVLKKAPVAEQALIDTAIGLAREHMPDIVRGDYEKVMNELHTHGK
ncbi:MAG TPA: aminoacyl-tRNA hydrolase [Acidiferrobacteraceae bacterium]|nr:aminoacyl-tRNA hydrolase [Acidiferrobacteraceae bacterium]